MNDKVVSNDHRNALPEAKISKKRFPVSFVWIIPVVAAIIGGILLFKAISEKGPEITISFETAEDLEAGKTKIKYKDVDLGYVDQIILGPDHSHVIVKAKLSKQAAPLLSENSRFWVVRARVAASQVSGLGTLFSGAYIAIDPGKPGQEMYHFKGLESPPIVTADLPGHHFNLKAKKKGSIGIRSPVYYRHVKVGEVVSFNLDNLGRGVDITIFIHEPFYKFIYNNTRFWESSGLDLTVDAKGLRVDTESILSLISGGITFGLPHTVHASEIAEENTTFLLYKNYRAAQQKTYVNKTRWLLHFDGSVRGLEVGAPVEFRGIQIGNVVDVKLYFDLNKQTVKIPVLIEIDTERIITSENIPDADKMASVLDHMVSRGLRARLKPGNLLTGQQLVEFDFFPKDPPKMVDRTGTYPELPTIPSPIEEIGNQVLTILKKFENLPIEEMGRDLSQAIKNTKQLTGSPELMEAIDQLKETLKNLDSMIKGMNTTLAPEIESTFKKAQDMLKKAEGALDAVEILLAQDSTLQYRLNTALEEVAGAMKSFRVLTDYLESHPESLLFGKGKKE